MATDWVTESSDSLLHFADLILSSVPVRHHRAALLDKVQDQMRQYARLEAEAEQAALALSEVKDEAVSSISEGSEVNIEELAERVKCLTDRYMQDKLAAMGDLNAHDKCLRLARMVDAATPAAAGADEELVVTGMQTATRDPWSKQEIRRPYRNRRCDHVYDHESLERLLGEKACSIKCPYMGCTNKRPLTWDDMMEDPVAKRAC
ncbi:E3 SUMO-protein ligase NSE2-like [Pollicipes pollicipes]|uniref:E3 SUMO-protein ligase NSE2-like n=1 Tax=Pollicipes pollicipes TaxID=41117 RepID=UPI001884CB7D|nr:E3 SUMO-protein ligase NSE2-like [Pollicipes pollicipes]XP_037089197.1 E3 SUMO-protein ligase NSE2-like [Pollicipes pollicipes]